MSEQLEKLAEAEREPNRRWMVWLMLILFVGVVGTSPWVTWPAGAWSAIEAALLPIGAYLLVKSAPTLAASVAEAMKK